MTAKARWLQFSSREPKDLTRSGAGYDMIVVGVLFHDSRLFGDLQGGMDG
jgi:hypothetical protein